MKTERFGCLELALEYMALFPACGLAYDSQSGWYYVTVR